MLYRALKNTVIHLAPNETADFDAGTGVVFVPQEGAKIFLHWLTDRGNMRSTYTMTYATRVEGKLKIINGSNTAVKLHVIQLD